MIYPLYRDPDTIVFNIDAEEGSVQEWELNGKDICRLTFKMPNAVDIRIGDYVLVDGKKYTFNTIPEFTKKGERHYEYNCTLESVQYELLKTIFQDGNGLSDFYLTGDLVFFVNHIITNMNRVSPGWTAGPVKGETETMNLQFSNEKCLAVLQRLCSQYSVNFKISDSKEISVDNFTQANINTFSYGEGNGLYELTRAVVTSKNLITRLYAYGGTKNIPSNYRNYSSRLKLPTLYIEKNVDKYGIVEDSVTFDDIYPRFKGTVTSIVDYITFRCSAIDFDLNNQKMPGIAMKVRFNSGQLAGNEFEISSYTHSTKEIKLNPNNQEKAYSNSGTLEPFALPNSFIHAGVGDRIVFIDIVMPETYITNGENEVLEKATELLNQNCDPRAQHELKIDPIYMKNSGIVLLPGDYINVKDTYLNIDKNDLVVSVTKNLYITSKIEVKLSDSVAPQISLNRNVATLEEMKRIVIRNQLGDIYRLSRGYKSMDENLAMIFDSDGYFNSEKIRPLSIETAMLAVGGKASQFSLSCLIEPNYNGNVNHCKLGAGTLAHFAISETIMIWNMSESIRTNLITTTAYYIYAKCLRSGDTGTLILDTVQRKVDSDPTNYYFLVGILNSVVNGMRLVSLMYGVTTINGGQIKTGTISSPDGLTYFDIQNGIIQGKIVFRSGSEGIENVLSLGGRNLLRNTVFKTDTTYWVKSGNHTMFVDTANQFQGYNSLKIVSTGAGNNSNCIRQLSVGIIPEKDHVISFWAKAETVPVGLITNIGSGSELVIPTVWTKFSVKTVSSVYQSCRFNLMEAGTVYITMVKLEQSNLSTEWSPAPEDINEQFALTVNYVDAIKSDLESQMDNQIMVWKGSYDPTLTNAPANTWTTTILKNDHLGDEFYRTDLGTAWKFIMEYNLYVWKPIEDVDITAALAAAANAQATADGKMRIFRSTPTPPYEIGDLWTQGPGGNIMSCKVEKVQGQSYSLSDWELASNYTDDTTANQALTEAQVKARNFSSQPVPPYRVNDTWQDGTSLKTCVLTRLTGNYVASDWAVRVAYDKTETAINGGIITTGRILLADVNGVVWGGMRGATGIDGTETGFWLGANFENMDNANIKLRHNGRGSMTGLTIQSAGSGKRIVIDSDNNSMTFYSDPTFGADVYMVLDTDPDMGVSQIFRAGQYYTKIMPGKFQCFYGLTLSPGFIIDMVGGGSLSVKMRSLTSVGSTTGLNPLYINKGTGQIYSVG
jgi:hypothetical protein